MQLNYQPGSHLPKVSRHVQTRALAAWRPNSIISNFKSCFSFFLSLSSVHVDAFIGVDMALRVSTLQLFRSPPTGSEPYSSHTPSAEAPRSFCFTQTHTPSAEVLRGFCFTYTPPLWLAAMAGGSSKCCCAHRRRSRSRVRDAFRQKSHLHGASSRGRCNVSIWEIDRGPRRPRAAGQLMYRIVLSIPESLSPSAYDRVVSYMESFPTPGAWVSFLVRRGLPSPDT